MLSPYSKDVREDEVPVAAPEAPKPELRAADCNTPEEWARWARERREYEDGYGYDRSRY